MTCRITRVVSEGEAVSQDISSQDSTLADNRAYGCVFCLSGKEEFVAQRLNELFPSLRTTTVKQVKRQTVKGKTQLVTKVIFSGYVFFEADKNIDIASLYHVEGVLRLLRHAGAEWHLSGNDETFVRWIFSYDGLIGLSTAYAEGDRIRIISGPLKDLEGEIKRIDRRNKSGQVAIKVGECVTNVWLGFELVDRLDGSSASIRP